MCCGQPSGGGVRRSRWRPPYPSSPQSLVSEPFRARRDSCVHGASFGPGPYPARDCQAHALLGILKCVRYGMPLTTYPSFSELQTKGERKERRGGMGT